MVTRRTLFGYGAGIAGLAACQAPADAGASGKPGFVTVDGQGLRIDGAPYRYVGANIWYGAYLGADAPFGNRDRLKRELDRLAAMGVDNLRVLASSELSPLKNSITPAFRTNDAELFRAIAWRSRFPADRDGARATCAPFCT